MSAEEDVRSNRVSWDAGSDDDQEAE